MTHFHLTSTMKLLVLLSCILFNNYEQAEIGHEKIITIPDGKIRGITMKTINNREILAYQGIPFARPPIGKLRFQPPQKVEPWEGIVDGTKPAEYCTQSQSIRLTKVIKGTEDCLTLDVFTPQINDTFSELFPVFVYLFGGLLIFGPIDSTTHERLLDDNVLYVQLKFRLGLLGFAATHDGTLSGSYGQLDNILALKWVQNNIAYFGGDPNRVTLLGHSTGSLSTMYHIISPLSNGLIHNAIMMSGCSLCNHIPDNTLETTLQVAQRANCSFNSSKSLEECLMIAPANDLFPQFDSGPMPYLPYYDIHNNSAYLPYPRLEMPFQSNVRKIPIIIGVLPNDGAFFVQDSNETIEEKLDQVLLHAKIPKERKPYLIKQLIKEYNLSIDTNKTAKETLETLQDIVTHMIYYHCCDQSVELLSKAGFPTYAYVIKNHGSVMERRTTIREYDHSSELDLLFVVEGKNKKLTGNDLLTSKALLHYWINFAKNGEPSPNNASTGKEKYPTWNLWTEDHPRHLVIERSPHMENGYFCKSKKFWNDILPATA